MVEDTENIEDLRRLAPDLAPSIAKLTCPCYILDRSGTVRWMNKAAIAHFGDLRGRGIGQIVDREFATLARQEFAAKVLGTVDATEANVVVRTADGRRVSVDISSSQLIQDGSIVGVFGLADPRDEPPPARRLEPSHAKADDSAPPTCGREIDRPHRRGAGDLDRNRAEPHPGHHGEVGSPQPPGSGDQGA